jgi:hypothetical protein
MLEPSDALEGDVCLNALWQGREDVNYDKAAPRHESIHHLGDGGRDTAAPHYDAQIRASLWDEPLADAPAQQDAGLLQRPPASFE